MRVASTTLTAPFVEAVVAKTTIIATAEEALATVLICLKSCLRSRPEINVRLTAASFATAKDAQSPKRTEIPLS
jgi:hypothetical protein